MLCDWLSLLLILPLQMLSCLLLVIWLLFESPFLSFLLPCLLFLLPFFLPGLFWSPCFGTACACMPPLLFSPLHQFLNPTCMLLTAFIFSRLMHTTLDGESVDHRKPLCNCNHKVYESSSPSPTCPSKCSLMLAPSAISGQLTTKQ